MLTSILHKVRIRWRELAAKESLYWARNEGDWGSLADHIRSGGLITSEMRPFIADVLDRKIAPPVGTAAAASTARLRRRRYHAVLEVMKSGKSETAAIAIVAEQEGMDASTVRRNVKRCKDEGVPTAIAHANDLVRVVGEIIDTAKKEFKQGSYPKAFMRYNLSSQEDCFSEYLGTTDTGTGKERMDRMLTLVRTGPFRPGR
jgi:hypothetical protein